ncbi:MAG: RNA methyltransferase [Myxococcales bacterium FL481]|nr:MAG: RNA methyltransferase [Myxococcales bacterium FL481]
MSRSKPRTKRADPPYVVPGERAVTELLRAQPQRVTRVVVQQGRDFPAVRELAAAAGRPVDVLDRRGLERLLDPALARGIVAVAESPLRADVRDLLYPGDASRRTTGGRRLLVALDGVLDPRNLGAIVRSAEFFGAAGVFYPRDRAATLSAAAVRASAGASERLAMACVPNLARALDECKDAGYWIVGTVVSGGRELASLVPELPEELVLVLGSEERGLRRLTEERCDFLATIPGASEFASLNVSCAAAVALAGLA